MFGTTLRVGKNKRARQLRRGYPIHAYIGANGGGKSLAAVYDTLPTLAAGRPVLSTVRLIDPTTGGDHPLWIPLGVREGSTENPYRALLEAEFCDVIFDEVTGIASSRDSMSLPSPVANHLVQLRRRDVALRWTAPSWKRADTIIREVSQAVTLCLGFWKQSMKAEDGTDRLWSSRKLFYWRTYDSAAFEEWSTAKRERLRPQARQLYWRDSSDAPAAYDTFDAVLSLTTPDDSGRCMDCNGNRPRPKCVCGSHKSSAKPVLVIAETDETPAVGVDLTTLPAASGLTSNNKKAGTP